MLYSVRRSTEPGYWNWFASGRGGRRDDDHDGDQYLGADATSHRASRGHLSVGKLTCRSARHVGALPPAHSFPLGIQFPRRGLECLGKQSGGNRQKRQSDNAVKHSVKPARRQECRCWRRKAIEVGYRGAFSRRGFG